MHASKIRIVARMLLIAVLAWAGALHAQNNVSPNNISAELVLIESRDGGREEVYAMHFRPQEGWHGYWSNPGDAGLGMQTEWSWPAEWFGTPQYPVPHRLTIAGLMNHVYEDDYAVLIPVSIPADVAGDDLGPLSVKAQWLACTDQICVPEEAELTARVALASDDVAMWRAAIAPPLDSQSSYEMVEGKLRLAIPIPANMALSQPHIFVETVRVVDYAADQTFRRQGDMLTIEIPLKGTAEPSEIEGILSLGGSNGVRFTAVPGDVPEGGELMSTTPSESPAIWVLLLGALAGGLILNIMPCVFPILSLKAISLARAGESQAQARGEGLAYTAGVVFACVALGGVMLALRAAGEQVGWAFQLQEPGVVVFLLVLAVAITANLAGLFELPQLSVTRSGEPASAFATGLLAAFVATPCTGPFMAAALGAALLLPPVQALALFAALGLGLALPFLLIGFVPSLRKLLPKPGAWMDKFRKIMAVPMGLTALALAWLTFQLSDNAFGLLAMAIAVAAVVLLALVGRSQRSSGSASATTLVGFLGLAIVGTVFLPRLYSPPVSGASAESILDAQAFSVGALAEARASGQPVFVWFTADWCVTCKVNEGIAIEREATKAAFEQAGVIAIVGDWTLRQPEITTFLNDRGAAGVPLYLWYEPGAGPEQLPQVLTADMLIERAGRAR